MALSEDAKLALSVFQRPKYASAMTFFREKGISPAQFLDAMSNTCPGGVCEAAMQNIRENRQEAEAIIAAILGYM